MPKVLLPVPSVNESVSRPVVLDVVRQLLESTNLPASTPIIYPGELEKNQQVGTNLSPDNTPNILPFDERITIEVEENYEMERLLSTAVYREENQFIFRDMALETYIKPLYSSQEITINVRYRALDRTQANRWRDNIRSLVSMNRDVLMHTLSYHYQIPPEMILILQEIHRLRENVAPYGQNWDTYFGLYATQRASIITTLAGTVPAWAISEKQLRVVGWFDFEGVPEVGGRENDGESWTIGFAYKFRFEKPIACAMSYPVMIHNQLLDEKYRRFVADMPEKHERSYNLTTGFLTEFEKGAQLNGIPSGYAIPAFDEFYPSDMLPDTTRVFTALTSIDQNDPLYLFTLTELGTFDFDPEVLEFLKGEIPYLTKPYFSLFNISLYSQHDWLHYSNIKIDSNFRVTSSKPLDLRKYHHVRFSIVDDWTKLSKDALDRLRKYGKVVIKCLEAIGYNGEIPTELIDAIYAGNGYVTREVMRGIINVMDRLDALRKVDYEKRYCFNTVGVLFVQAYRAPS